MSAVGIKKYLLSLFLFSLALNIPTSTAILSGNETDQLALLSFKEMIVDDPLGVLESWNNSINVCLWQGIICGRRHKRVTSINLTSQSLVGTLSPDIGNMSYLNEIILYNNSLQGGIPQEVDRLSSLQVLSLGRNELEGKIPKTLGRVNRLVILELSSNKLSGMIPASVFNLSLLKVFNLANNQLQGSLPSDFGLTLPNLQKIQLSNNNFTGSIPITLSNASKLQVIDLKFNSLSGPVSVDFGRLLHLQKLSLENNNLEFGERGQLNFLDSLITCSRLNILELGANNFRGPLPRSIANLSNELTVISLADNQISGSIPSEICKFTNLIFFSLASNKFTGIIPSQIGRLSKLQRLVLSNNRLTGNIPASIWDLSLLDAIHLENNELSGTIPPSFGRCPMLVLLDLSQNNLRGTIPVELFHISRSLVKLNLSQNHLVGSLPAEISVLTYLVELDISENELSGLFPKMLGGCITLEIIDLSRNNLSGILPAFLETLSLQYLNLSWNNFKGKVPTKGVFVNASTFSIVGNKRLCGGIPELKLSKCNSLPKGNSDRSRKHKMSGIQVLILTGSILLLLAISYISHILLRRREEMKVSYELLRQATKGFSKVSYELLHQATNGFSRTYLVSEGGSGSMYKGELVLNNIGMPGRRKTAVAIKVFNTWNEAAVNCFINECKALQNIRHRNIVKIISTCSSTMEKNHDFKAIVYGFKEHGSLARWLHLTSQTSPDQLNMPRILNLCTRINIANDVASALNYLHTQLDDPLILRNLNANNIWLDTNMTAHVSNFGLAKFLTEISSKSPAQIITGAAGTPGYIPPEYDLGRIMSTKVDVYSYGILLLEMLTGKKTTDPMFHEGFKLQNFVSDTLADGGVKEVIDLANLHELRRDDAAQVEDCLSILFNIGLKCASELPQFRPEISDILSTLETVKIIFKINTGGAETYAKKSPQAAVLVAQRNMKSLLTKKMPPTSSTMFMLPSVTLSYMDLHKATNGLCITHLVGAGRYGSVYRGTFHQEYGRLLVQDSGIEDETGTTVAIKVFNLKRRGAVRSFKTEYKTLRNIHHPNLVKIITTCTSVDQEGNDFRAIIYEFMDHGSLEMWLHPTNKAYHDGHIKPRLLSLHARINIAIDVASALSYLHHQCANCIIHCDIKPSNILLDKNMVARIADFGLAASLSEFPSLNQNSSSTGIRGTAGYIAPEYGLGCKMTAKGDTYSFGILLLEMLTSKKPTHGMFQGGINLHNFVWTSLPDNVIDITDPLMKITTSINEGDGKQLEDCLTRMFNIGLACSSPSPKDRPDMCAVTSSQALFPPKLLGSLSCNDFSNNRLRGNIPASIGNLSMLDEIHLGNNELSGTIPPSFGRCPMLVLLDLSQNNLRGTIPNKLFDISPFSVKLNLSRNHLVGSLPQDIRALETIVELDVSENELSGLIPDMLGGCITLGLLYMQGNFIQGKIPHSIEGLKSMEIIDLSHNNLTGILPTFSEALSLKYSDLSWNNFEGEVPTEGVFANASTFSIVGNKGLCGGIPELQLSKCNSLSKYNSDRSHKHEMSWIRVLFLTGSILVLLAISYISHILLRRREPVSHSQSKKTTEMKVSYELLCQATKGFSRTYLVSEGGSGSLYKGELVLNNIGMPGRRKTTVAIKVFNTWNKAAVSCFINECEALQNICHSSIVKIISTCSSTVEMNHDFKAIVYGFKEHGSLARWLHLTSQTSPDKLNMPRILNLCTRINIANDVASALNYLHTQLDDPLILCNLNASNIWLDTNMTAHVSNFGLAKFLTETGSNSRPQIITAAAGTPGYIPPEYDLGRIMSTKVDVYSYGILLLEMLTGKKTTDPMFHEGYKLQNFVSNALVDGNVKEIIDPANLHELIRDDAALVEDCLSILFYIGMKCASELPQFRPEISDILSMLEIVRIIFEMKTGSTETYANRSSKAAVLTAQRNMKSLLTKKMAPNSSTISMLPSVTVSYMDLHKATNGLCTTHLVGAGGYGSVYRGTVAIKVFNLQRRGAARSFKTEYKTLRNIHHANLVKIITTCTSLDQEGHDFRAIVYEFMDHGSLEMWLHPTKKVHHDGPIKPRLLSLHARINIAADVACALSYLHHQCANCIIHCDIKPSNILLDKNMIARIADFGLAASLSEFPSLNQNSSLTGIRGTAGYIAPEYGLGCKMTTKGDIYSFGILLLEMLTSKKPTHRMFRGGLNLHNFVWLSLPDNVIDITDPLMKVMTSINEGDGKQLEDCLTRMFNIGLACSNPTPKDRPDMRAVLCELESIRNNFMCPTMKFTLP